MHWGYRKPTVTPVHSNLKQYSHLPRSKQAQELSHLSPARAEFHCYTTVLHATSHSSKKQTSQAWIRKLLVDEALSLKLCKVRITCLEITCFAQRPVQCQQPNKTVSPWSQTSWQYRKINVSCGIRDWPLIHVTRSWVTSLLGEHQKITAGQGGSPFCKG